MQINCLWTGREYHSLENCLVNISDAGAEIISTIVGYYERKIYQVDYVLKTNDKWETVYFEVRNRHNNQTQHMILDGDGKGNWFLDGKKAEQFKRCIDIDISLTPLTNTLPINRLDLALNQSKEVQVIYVDLLQQQLISVRQQYTRLSGTLYDYQNIPNDFQSNILVDEFGLVVDYPRLFKRTCTLKSAYPNSMFLPKPDPINGEI